MMTTHHANQLGVRIVGDVVKLIAQQTGERFDAPLSPARRIIYGQLAMALLLRLAGNDFDAAFALFEDMIKQCRYETVRRVAQPVQ